MGDRRRENPRAARMLDKSARENEKIPRSEDPR